MKDRGERVHLQTCHSGAYVEQWKDSSHVEIGAVRGWEAESSGQRGQCVLKAGGKHWLCLRMEQGSMCLKQRSGGENRGK